MPSGLKLSNAIGMKMPALQAMIITIRRTVLVMSTFTEKLALIVISSLFIRVTSQWEWSELIEAYDALQALCSGPFRQNL